MIVIYIKLCYNYYIYRWEGSQDMVPFFDIFGKMIEKLKIKEVILAVLIVGVIVLFMPVDFISVLGLDEWRNKYRSVIGLIVLFCGVCCLIWLFVFLKNKFFPVERREAKFIKKYLMKLISSQEKEFLINHFFNFDRQEFMVTAQVDLMDGCVASLTSAFIIYRAANIGYGPNNWSYNLQPIAQRYLNKAILNKKNYYIS